MLSSRREAVRAAEGEDDAETMRRSWNSGAMAASFPTLLRERPRKRLTAFSESGSSMEADRPIATRKNEKLTAQPQQAKTDKGSRSWKEHPWTGKTQKILKVCAEKGEEA